MMKKKEHKILDHPVLGYFLLLIFVNLFVQIGTVPDYVIGIFVPEYAGGSVALGVGAALFSLIPVLIFNRRFSPDFKGVLGSKNMKMAFLIMLPCLIIHYTGSIISWFQFGVGNVFIAFLRATAPGFSEEITFRGLGVSNYMRTVKSEGQIRRIFWLSSVVFGLAHILNILVGGDVFSVLIQVPYAVGIGMLFGAVYLRTGNLWATIIAHTGMDFLEMIRADVGASGGVMTGMGIGDWVTVVAAVVAGVIGFKMTDKKYHSQIMEVWDEKWSKEQYPETEEAAKTQEV